MSPSCHRSFVTSLLLLWLALSWSGSAWGLTEVEIGVLAKRGRETAVARWSPLADYLSATLPDYHFTVRPLDFQEFPAAVRRNEVDFFITNPGMYVALEVEAGAMRIATLLNRGPHGEVYDRFGGVIFTRADAPLVHGLADLAGRSFIAVDESSFGGFVVAWGELAGAGIDPWQEPQELRFAGTHDAVVYAVREGRADVGLVRTDTLERMAEEGKIPLDEFRVLNAQEYPNFAYRLSTWLYPEWPFARSSATSTELTRQVQAALLTLPPESPAARAAQSAGWGMPQDYHPIHDLLRQLAIGPYRPAPPTSAGELLRRYRGWVAGAGLMLLLLIGVNAHIARLNLRLRRSEQALREARDHLAVRVDERTIELEQALSALRESHQRLDLSLRDWNDAFDAIADPIFIHDRELRIVHANPAYLARAGVSREVAVGRHYFTLFPIISAPLRQCSVFPEQMHSAGEEIQLADGTQLVSRSFGIRRADGSVENAIHILEDVTTLRRTEGHRRTLARAVAQAGEGVVIVDRNLVIQYANPALALLLGEAAEVIEGRGLLDLLPPDERAARPDLTPGPVTAEAWSGELRLQLATGALLPAYLTGGDIVDDSGVVIGHVLTLVDLRPVKEAQEAQQRRLRFESLIAATAGRFVAFEPEALQHLVRDSLAQLAAFLGADRAWLYRQRDTADTMVREHAWCQAEQQCDGRLGVQLSLAALPWLQEQLRRSGAVALDGVEAAGAELVREALLSGPEASAVVVPLRVEGGELAGLLGIELSTAHHSWPQEDVALVQAAAGILAAALGRAEAEEAVRRSQASLAESQHIARLGNWEWDIVSGQLHWSDEIYRIFGVAPQEFGATFEAFLSYVHPADRAPLQAEVDRALQEALPYAFDHRVVLADGRERVVHESGAVTFDDERRPLRMVGTVQDVTEARQAEAELRRLNRALRALSRGNGALVHAVDEPGLLQAICNVLIDDGGYRLVWVGYACDDGRLEPVTAAGADRGFMAALKVSWREDEEIGRGPAGTAIRERRVVVIGDVTTDLCYRPWREAALAGGYASVMALPLLDEGEPFGALVIYAGERNAFDSREQGLLTEFAADLAFGIVGLRTRAGRVAARAALEQSEARYHALYENAPNAYLSVAADGQLLHFNRALPALLGYDHEQLTGMAVLDLFADAAVGRGLARRLFTDLQAGEAVRDLEVALRHRSGATIWASLSLDPVVDGEGKVVESRVAAIDISNRKQAEQERNALHQRLQRALLQTIQAISVTIEKRDPYTAGHQQRVAELCVAIAQELALDADRTEGLRLGALIHDIGKIYVPTEILNRPGRLDEAQRLLIRAHPQVGYEIVAGIEFPWPLADMVVQHHERLDGSGYPKGLTGDAIALEARILAVADVVEAMATHRPYRPALALDDALAEIEGHSGEWFDPEVVAACVRLFRDQGFGWDGILRG